MAGRGPSPWVLSPKTLTTIPLRRCQPRFLTAGEIILKVQGKDSYCNDGFDYTLTPSIDKTNQTRTKTDSSTPKTIALSWSVPPPTTARVARTRTAMGGRTLTTVGASRTGPMRSRAKHRSGWIRTTTGTATIWMVSKATTVGSVEATPRRTDTAVWIPTAIRIPTPTREV